MRLPPDYLPVTVLQGEPLPPLSPSEATARQLRLVDELARRHANDPVSDRLRSVRADLVQRLRTLSLPQTS